MFIQASARAAIFVQLFAVMTKFIQLSLDVVCIKRGISRCCANDIDQTMGRRDNIHLGISGFWGINLNFRKFVVRFFFLRDDLYPSIVRYELREYIKLLKFSDKNKV